MRKERSKSRSSSKKRKSWRNEPRFTRLSKQKCEKSTM